MSDKLLTASTKTQSYRDLIVWQKGIALTKEVYQLTAALPDSERFGLISQLRRAAVSIPSNIAEGQARHTTADFIRFLAIAEGSVAELDTQLVICIELGFLNHSQVSPAISILIEIRLMLNALRRKLMTTK